MALATTVEVEHLALGERPQYGQPYPDGIAVASDLTADDASGGAHTWAINADPGFLYRLELFTLTRGEGTARQIDVITSHRWAAEKSRNPTGFDLNWPLAVDTAGTFTVYVIALTTAGEGVGELMPMLRRFAMGAALGGGAPGVSVLLMNVDNAANTTGVTNELSVVWTYWRKEALYLPGFLSAFYEAPAAPPVVR